MQTAAKRKVIFVFGSNLAGVHGAGAAAYAARHYGAKRGVGEGMTGDSYALPTKDGNIMTRSRLAIRDSIKRFLTEARNHPEFLYKVTRVGCGLAGFTNAQIAPFFAGAPSNCGFDPEWKSFGLQTWAEAGIPE